ncbi:hypothetical protein BGZ75_008638 [Mortierella antarctica]|nr:hypothetical protein BGZ67_002261 [Mortierella alpina]KAF9980271.1 hypothetical protein BGZ75_008638 [Mortierella antarctica]
MSLSSHQMEEAAQLLPELLAQEQELQFPRFTNDDALELGNTLVLMAKNRTPFKGTTVDNENWMRRKVNTVVRLQHSSYYIGRLLASKGQTDMEKAYMVPAADHACHGGAFPLLIKHVGCVGAIVVSGLKQDEDHAMVVQGIRQMIAIMKN